MKSLFWLHLLRLGGLMLLMVACSTPTLTAIHEKSTKGSDVVVDGKQWGRSTCYIGATEGTGFNIADLKDLGINSYHIYGGMSRWEAQDDSNIYGSPTIDQIKANPNSINWTRWDNVMTNPPGGSDYWWTYQSPAWHGNARTLFSTLQAAGIRPIVTLRTRDNLQNPSWPPNPPTTQADWNEWWEHVFATVYWLNVRNDYNVNDFEVLNEPDVPSQGWAGTETQYISLLQYTDDAISYVYKTYLPGRVYHIYAPATSTGSSWPYTLLQQAPAMFDSLDIHDYNADIRTRVQQTHHWLHTVGRDNYPIWLSEWGSYRISNKYDTLPTGISLINNLIYGSQPGDDYVYGNEVFSLYDYGKLPLGLIKNNGTRRTDYYAMRLAIRALQGCRPTYQSKTNSPNLLAITTRGSNGNLFFLITSQTGQQNNHFTVDLSALLPSGRGTIWQFDAHHNDQVMGNTIVKNGQMTLTMPAAGAVLVEVSRTS